MKPMKTIVASVTALLVAATAFAQLSKSDIKKLNEATTVLSEIQERSGQRHSGLGLE